MRLLADLKARFPRLYPLATLALGLGAIAGTAAYEAKGDCCYPGAPCCHPGAACCAHAKTAAK